MSYSLQHLKETADIVSKINPDDCEKCVKELVGVRTRGGRLFILGVGGSAANASHAVNDFRKIAGIEVYAPTDNVSELTARTNDDGCACCSQYPGCLEADAGIASRDYYVLT